MNKVETMPVIVFHRHLKGAIFMGTVVVGAVILALVGMAVRSMVHDKQNGKSIQCGGDCSHCGGHCH